MVKLNNIQEFDTVVEKLKSIQLEPNSSFNFSKAEGNITESLNTSVNQLKTNSVILDSERIAKQRSFSLNEAEKTIPDIKHKNLKLSTVPEQIQKNICLDDKTKEEGDIFIDKKQLDIDKEDILVELDKVNETVYYNRHIIKVANDSILYLVSKTGAYKLIRKYLSKITNIDAMLYIIQRFKFIKYSLLIFTILYVFLNFSTFIIIFTVGLIAIMKLDSKNNINFFFVKYIPLNCNKSTDDILSIEENYLRFLRHMLNKNVNSIFPGISSPEKLVELQKFLKREDFNDRFEVYLIDFVENKIKRYLKVKICCDKVIFKYYGKISMDVYQKLEFISLKFKMSAEFNKNTSYIINNKNMKHKLQNKENNIETKVNANSNTKLPESLLVSNKITDQNLDAKLAENTYSIGENVSLNKKNELVINKNSTFIEIKDKYSTQAYIDILYECLINKYYNLITDETKWKVEHTDSVYTMKSLSDATYLIRRTETQINSNIKKITSILENSTLATKYNHLISSETKIKQLTPEASLNYIIVKCPFPLTNRDYAHIRICKQHSDKKMIIITTSAPESLFPSTKKFVRGNINRFY